MRGYAVCLEQTKTKEKPEGDKGEAWNLYYQRYRAKREKYANRLIGQGGYASLNGDPALEICWIKDCQEVYPGDKIILETDGFLWADWRLDNAQEVIDTYQNGGASALLSLRDEKDYLPHIGHGNHPEGTLVEIEIEE